MTVPCPDCGLLLYKIRWVTSDMGPTMPIQVHVDTIRSKSVMTNYGNNWFEVLEGENWVRVSSWNPTPPAQDAQDGA